MTEHFEYIKVYVNLPEHPRTLDLSDAAFRALIELWCYCKRNNTDGRVPLPVWNGYHYRVRKGLSKHYVIEHVDHAEMTGYLEHQISSAKRAELRKHRAEAGKRGGQARAKNLALAKQTSDSPLKIEKEREKEKESKDSLGASRRRAVALPADFHVNESMRAWATEQCPGVDVEQQTANFKDWHTAKGSTFKDWPAAWRTWMRRIPTKPPAMAAPQQKEWWFTS